jgi:glycosyltransferase involved in cell wall biosynthesis
MLTYEFPPSGGGGVQRIAKFSRYLPEFGWEPLVVCARPIAGRPTDPSLVEEVRGVAVTRTAPLNPTTTIARLLAPFKPLSRALSRSARAASVPAMDAASAAPSPAAKSRMRPPLSARISRRLTLDDAQYWAGPAVRAAIKLGRESGTSVVIASGPPFSVIVAGSRVAAKLGVPLVVDLRDTWRDNPTSFYPRQSDRERSLRLERESLAAATVVLGASAPIVIEAAEMGARDARLLTNGFDSNDLDCAVPSKGAGLHLAFMGKLYRGLVDPWFLLEAIARLRAIAPDAYITLDLIGSADEHVSARVRELGLEDRVHLRGYLPHRQAIQAAACADVGIVLIGDVPGARASITGKLFEYLGMGLPVLVLGPVDGEAAKLVESIAAGWSVAPDDIDAIARTLLTLIDAKATGEPLRAASPDAVSRYERRSLSSDLAAILDEVTSP